MKRSLRGVIVLVAWAVLSAAAGAGEFQAVSAKTLDKQEFEFPADVRGGRLNVLFLAMSLEQDNGEYQQGALLEWYEALDARGVFDDDVVAWHFPVMSGPPFFIKGVIRRAIRNAYDGKIELDHGAVLFVDDLQQFADAAGLPLDGRPTVVIASAEAIPLRHVKGEVTPAAVDEIATQIERLAGE